MKQWSAHAPTSSSFPIGTPSPTTNATTIRDRNCEPKKNGPSKGANNAGPPRTTLARPRNNVHTHNLQAATVQPSPEGLAYAKRITKVDNATTNKKKGKKQSACAPVVSRTKLTQALRARTHFRKHDTHEHRYQHHRLSTSPHWSAHTGVFSSTACMNEPPSYRTAKRTPQISCSSTPRKR